MMGTDIAISMPTLREDNIFYDLRLCDNCSGAILYGNSDSDYTRDIVVLPDYSNTYSLGLQFLTIDFDEDGHKDLLLALEMGVVRGYGGGDNYYDEIYLPTHNVSGRNGPQDSSLSLLIAQIIITCPSILPADLILIGTSKSI